MQKLQVALQKKKKAQQDALTKMVVSIAPCCILLSSHVFYAQTESAHKIG